MALFKVIKISLRGAKEKTAFRVNVNESGSFSCKISDSVMSTIMAVEEIERATFNELDHELHALCRKYDKLKTKHKFVIWYAFHISPHVKYKMPPSIMNEEMFEKTKASGGSTNFHNDSFGLVFEWYPGVITTLGENSVAFKMQLADEDDLENHKTYGELWDDKFHKPFNDLLFIEGNQFWDFQMRDNYFELPLNEKTMEFFQGLEGSMVQLVTKIFEFLSMEPKQLMAAITKSIDSKQNFLLGK